MHLTRTLLLRVALAFIAGGLLAAGAVWWAARERVALLQSEVRAQSQELLGYTRYTSYLTVGKQSLAEQMKLLSATVVREEGSTQIIEKSLLGLASTGVVAVTYTAEYAFGFDLGPDQYDLKATDKGIEVHVNPPRLVATPAVTNLRHRVVSGGLLTDEKAAIIRLQEEAARRARQQGQAMASEPAVVALCEKSLTAFLYAFLEKQPGVKSVPRITVVYRQPPKAASTAQ
ncbi:hypothetical protein PMI14_00574 [Acidovorax sp. CF316]|uniref:hypothetical protein n=1 Tax=Acidovorax sp. CF316 TaxID=1144317 RepID=UPI00026BC645|nr:hypothetical protein [Acidovorax sp. CF316]EJE54474.1 hypothetical protein PMI14_00574 [Acidovorax sp. CF316]